MSEPDIADTVSILRGLKEKYELHHGVRITDPALVAAAHLSNRYITDRFLPDKAIDLVDEAASRRRMEMDSKPETIDELDRRIIQLKIEREALKRESDSASRERLDGLDGELADLEAEAASMTEQWQAEKDKVSSLQGVQERLDRARQDLDQATRDGELAKAGEVTYAVIPNSEASGRSKEAPTQRLLGEEVSEADIAAVVSRATGIPVDRMMAGEREKLLGMESALEGQVIGQTAAVAAVSDAVRQARAGLQDPARPIGSFLFFGADRGRENRVDAGPRPLPVRR